MRSGASRKGVPKPSLGTRNRTEFGDEEPDRVCRLLGRRLRHLEEQGTRMDQDYSGRGYATHMPNSLNSSTMRSPFAARFAIVDFALVPTLRLGTPFRETPFRPITPP